MTTTTEGKRGGWKTVTASAVVETVIRLTPVERAAFNVLIEASLKDSGTGFTVDGLRDCLRKKGIGGATLSITTTLVKETVQALAAYGFLPHGETALTGSTCLPRPTPLAFQAHGEHRRYTEATYARRQVEQFIAGAQEIYEGRKAKFFERAASGEFGVRDAAGWLLQELMVSESVAEIAYVLNQQLEERVGTPREADGDGKLAEINWTFEGVVKVAARTWVREVCRAAGDGNSSSAVSNLAVRCRGEGFAKAIESLRYTFKLIGEEALAGY